METPQAFRRHARTFSLEFPRQDTGMIAVIRFQGEEELSRPYRFAIDFAARDSDMDRLVNQNAVFTIKGPANGRKSVYRGLVVEIEQTGRVMDFDLYRVVIMPAVISLAKQVQSEIYVDNQIIPEIVKKIFKDCRIPHVMRPTPINRAYEPFPFICQYEESLLDFATRLMERDGLYYFFEEEGEDEIAVIADDRAAHKPVNGPFVYRDEAMHDDKYGESTIPALSMRRRTLPREIILKSYNYQKSSLGSLKEAAKIMEDGMGDIILSDEYFRTTEEGNYLARLRAEAILCRERVFTAESAATGLKAGSLFSLSGHYREDFNQQYLVIAASHRGSQPSAYLSGLGINIPEDPARETYWNRLELIPGALQYRPERRTPKPRISGTVTAVIDGEGTGRYAEVNEDGEYMVRFPTLGRKRPDAKGSAWIRMTSPYGGEDHGMHFPLLKGAEVMVAFRDGDPDQPFISGTVPNSVNKSVVNDNNHSANVLRTAGKNSLTIGDDEGSSHITMKTAQGHSLEMKDRDNDKGVGIETASGQQAVNLRDKGEDGEVILAASTPLEAFGVSAPEIAHIQEKESRVRVGSAVSGIELVTNNSLNKVSLVSDSSISLGMQSHVAMGYKGSFCAGLESAVSSSYGRDLLLGGSEYSAKSITRFCGQEYVNISQQNLMGGQQKSVLGGGFLPTVDVLYRSLKKAFMASLATTFASTAAGCTADIMHAGLEKKLWISGAFLGVALSMWMIKEKYFNAIVKAPPASSYAGLLEMDYKGARMSCNPVGGILNLTAKGALLASNDAQLSSVNANLQGLNLKGVLIDVNAEMESRLHGKTSVLIKSDGVFNIQSKLAGVVKAGDSQLSLLPGAAQLVSSGIVKIG